MTSESPQVAVSTSTMSAACDPYIDICLNIEDPGPLLAEAIAAANDALTAAFDCMSAGNLCDAVVQEAYAAAELAGQVADDCLNNSYSLCQEAVALTLQTADLVVRLGLACVNGEDAFCRSLFEAARQAVRAALAEASGCLGDSGHVCQSTLRAAVDAANATAALAVAVAGWCLKDSSSICQTTITTAVQAANAGVATALYLATWCVNDSSSLCQQAVRTAVDTANGTVATVTGLAGWCLKDSTSLCQQVIKTGTDLANQQVAAVKAAAEACLNDYYGTCQSTIRTALETGRWTVATVTGTANWCLNDSSSLCQTTVATAYATAAAALATAYATADACLNNPTSPCQTTIAAAKALADSIAAAAAACVNETNSTCKTALDAARHLLAEGTQCAGGHIGSTSTGTGTGTTSTSTSGTTSAAVIDISDTCAYAKATALAAAKLAVDTAVNCVNLTDTTCRELVERTVALVQRLEAAAQACANESDPTCATALQAARNVVYQAGRCTDALGSVSVGTASTTMSTSAAAFDGYAFCAFVRATAIGLVDLAVSTAIGCINLENPTCRQVSDTAAGLARTVQDTVAACVNETDATCKTALQAVRNIVYQAGRCAGALGLGVAGASTVTTSTAAVDGYALCKFALDSAAALVKYAADTLTACVNQSDAVCRDAVARLQALVAEANRIVAACLNETNAECRTALEAVRKAISDATQCASATCPLPSPGPIPSPGPLPVPAPAPGPVPLPLGPADVTTQCLQREDATEDLQPEELEDDIDPADVDLALDLDVVVPEIERILGSRYGDVYIVGRGAAGLLCVQAVSPAGADQAAVSSVTGGRGVVVPTAYSASDLESFRTAISDVLSRTDEAYMLTTDTRENVISLTAPVLGETTVQEIRNSVPADALTLDVGPTYSFGLLATNRKIYPPYYAGAAILVSDGRSNCTSAYQSSDGFLSYGSTAGHCVGGRGASTFMGPEATELPVTENHYRGRARTTSDSAIFRVSYDDATRGRVLVADGKYRDVTGKFTRKGLKNGTRLCFQGISSDNNNCGPINATNVEYRDGNDPVIERAFCLKHKGERGDSGGAVYQVKKDRSAKAAGIASYRAWVRSGWQVNRSTCFTTIEEFEKQAGTRLVTR